MTQHFFRKIPKQALSYLETTLKNNPDHSEAKKLKAQIKKYLPRLEAREKLTGKAEYALILQRPLYESEPLEAASD